MHFPASDDRGDPRATPLYAATAALSAANSWTTVNGFATARVYTAVDEEYRAAGSDAALVDLGPMQRYTVRGSDAVAILARLTSMPVDELDVGESARGLILDADGFVNDFADVTRLSGDLFLLTTATPADRRLQLAARGFAAEILNVGSMVAALGVCGPQARTVAAAAGIDLLSADATAQGRMRGVELAVRTISFGAAPGVEIIYPADEALVIFERLRRARRLIPAGVDALEVLRIEGGIPRLGVDFAGAGAHIAASDRRTPAEIGLPHLAPVNRAWFTGRRAMKARAEPRRRLIVLSIDAEKIPAGAAVFARGAAAGRITSAAFSPRLRRVVAFAEIAMEALDHALEIGADKTRHAAQPLETPESGLAEAFRKSAAAATESRRARV